MAKHKAPTQVTIHTAEKSSFAQFVEDHWMKAAGLALVIIVAILGTQYMGQKEDAEVSARWDVFLEASQTGEPADLDAAAVELKGTPVEPWLRLAQVTAAAGEREYGESEAALAALGATGSSWLTENAFPITEDGPNETIEAYLQRNVAGSKAFDDANPNVFKNPAAPEGSPRVRMETSAGDIVIALYQEEAPKHVENFLKHVSEDYYVGTKFHRVIPNFMIQGGDTNTIEGEIDTWGQGGPGYKVDRETNSLIHDRGVLSAAKMPQEFQSSGSQFFITVAPAHHLDGQHTVYGEVVEGMDIVDKITAGEVLEATATVRDVPVDPISITKVTLLE